MNDNKRKLYDALSNDYDMGTYEQFRKDLEDKDKRRKLYDATSEAYDFGDYDQFEAQLGYGQSQSAPSAEEINSGSAGPVMPKPAMENRNWEVQMGNGHSRATVEKPEPVDVPIPQRPEDQEPSDDGTAAPSGDVRSYLENANRQQVANLSRDINSRLDEAQTKSRDIYMKEQEDARKGGFLSTLAHAIAASGHNPEGRSGGMSDAQQRTLQGANSELQSEISKLEAAKKAMSNAEEIIAEADKSVQEQKFPGFFKGIARGFGDKLFDVNTWDMGVSDTKNSIELLKALRKYDEGEPLSESEQMLLDAKSVELATNAYFGSYIGRGYKAGAVTAQSLPFMLEMAVNPASTLGESTQSMLARYALSRFAKKGATRAAQKFATKAAGAAGRALGDIAGSAVMAGTSGAVRVAGDAIDRHVGDIETDMDGQGQTVFAGHDPESLGKSIAKAFTSTAIENHSEMLGEYFAPALGIVSKLGRKGMEKFGLKKVVDFVDDVSATDAAKLIADFQKRTKWNGTIGEYAEEVAGNIENAILVGDNTLDASDDTGVFNLDQNIDTFLGVALMGGVFSAVRTAMWRTPKYRARMEMEKARDEARTKYGSEAWQEIEDRMAEAGDDGMSAVLSTVIAGENSPEKAKALLDYAKSIKKYEGMLAGDEKRREIASPEATDLETSYENGYTLSTPQEVHDAKLMFEYQEAMLQKALGTSDIDIDTIMLGNEMGTLTDGQKSVAMDYLNAKATFDGVIDRVRDDLDSRISSVENAIDASTNRDTGMLQPASLVDDRPVHIISGIVRLTPDGTMVDTRNSENFIIVRDDRTGRMETISPSDINRLENEIDPAMEKQTARQQIQDVYGGREADSIDGVLAFNPGDTYTLTNGQGQSFPVQIVANEQGVADNGDGTVNVILNNDVDTQTGQPRVTQMPKEQIQEMAEATNLSRLQQYEQQKLDRAAEQAETDATGRTPENPFRINDRITLSDAETGNVENGVVGSELTDDGKYEVVVEKQDGSQSILYLSPSELEQLGAKLEQPEAVEERNAPVLEQNQPVLEQKTEKTEQDSAMSRIPSDRDGVPQFEQAQPSDTWEALLELNSGNAVEAEDTARQMYENASKNLDKAQKTKPKSGTSVMEIQRNKAERNGQIDELRKSVDFWGKVLSFPEAVRKSASAAAEAAARQKEDAKREAARQAKENLAKGRKLMQQKGTYYKDDAKLGDYLDFHDYALRMIANGRVKFVWKNDADNNSIKGLGGHLGLEDSESERKALFSLLANQDKGGLRPDDAAEQLSEEYNSSLGAEVISSSEALDVILDIIRTYGGKTRDMMNAAIDAHAMAGMDERGHDEDSQGNPINSDGSLYVESVSSIDEITDEDFTNPTRSIVLPEIPQTVDEAIGANGKPVVIKKNIFMRNSQTHPEVTPQQAREIISSALYRPDLYGQNQKTSRPYNWIVINTKDSAGQNRLVVLEVNENKDNVEIIHWYNARNSSIEQIKRQAQKEGGLILILPSETEEAGGLSSRQSGLSSEGKDNVKKTESQEGSGKKVLIKGKKWETTTEPEAYRSSTKKRADSHDIVWFIGNKRYGSTTAERDLIEAEAAEYGGYVGAWNAYEEGKILLGKNEAALMKKMAEQESANKTTEALSSNSSEKHLAENPNDLPDLLPAQENNASSEEDNMSSEGKDTNISEGSNTGSEKSVAEQITEQREVVNTEPTEAQKEAGNYRMGHVKIDGMDVTIENPKGSIRRGTDSDGKKWESEMHYDYGYIRGTKAVDNDHIDIFLSDNPETGNVFVVDQVNPKTGEFDESKVMYGFASEQEARDAYLSNYEKGWKGLGKITEVTREEFKKWIESSTRKTKPFSEYASVKTAEAQKEKGTSTEVSDSSKNNTSDKASERGFILMDDFIESALQEAYENRTDKSLSRDDWNEEDEAIDAENKANDDYYQYIESLSNSGELQKMYDASSIGEQIKIRKSIGEAGYEFKDLIDTTKAADARKEAREKKKEEYRLKMKTLGIDIEDDDVQPSTKKPEAQKEKPVQGLEGYSRDEIKGIVTDHINDVMRDYDIDAEIIGMDIHGSRNRHDARPDSDLDVVVEYSGDIREDDMFNALNGEEDALSIEGIKVDINPIRKEETGDLQDYMKQSEEYDKEKSEHAKQKGSSATSEIKNNKSEKIEDYGEQISGARKDMLSDLAKTVQNTSLESLISLPFSKAFKKPNLRKAVEEGALRDKDARFAQAAIAAFLSTKKPVAGTKDERRRQRWGEKTNVEKWAEKAYTGIKILQELFDADERVRDKVIEAAVADKYVGVAEAKAQQQRIGELNYREFNGTSYPLNLIALYNEVFDRLGYPAGQDTKIPVGRIVCDSTFDSYSLRGTNGEDWLYSSRSLKSFEDVVDELVYLIKVANADETADHPIENFKIRGINPKVETTGYRVLAAKNLTTAITRGNRFAVDEIFPTREAALKRIEELKATGLECSEPLEKRETVGYEKYQISFAHPITREFIPLEKEYDSKEEAISAPEAEHEELNRLANEAIAAATRKSGESVEKSYFHITHYYDKGSDGKYHWYYGVALDDKYGPKKTAYNTMPFFLAERLNSREEAQKQIEANKERWESLVKDVVRQRSNFVYFSGGNETRKGEDYRNGKDVTAEEFANKFGFRGVQFGNWANQADRQAALNNAYDSFMDMSKIIGVSPKAMSLNGELGVAFGSRGSGAASAHYEPDEVVINLTKTRGAGSLAHEWWHALDNYFSRAANVKLGYVTSDKRLPMREEMRKAFNDLVDDVEKSDYHTRSMDRGSGYWGTRVEETARLFAEWIADEMAKRGELNNFLAGRNDSEDSYARMGYVFYRAIQKLQPEGEGEMMTFEEFRKTPMALKGFSYPTRAELETLGKDVRNIFGVVQERTDETTGNVALFQMVDKILSDNSPENRLAYEAVSQILSNAGIPVELLSDQAMREMAINATMLDTVLPEDESSFKGTVISSIDGAKILNNLDKAIDRYNENPDNRPWTFIGDLASALGSSDKDKSSQYATFETKNGQVVTIRVSNHNATVSNFDNAGESNGISIVISRKPNEGMTNDGDAHIVEFFYPDKALNKAEGKPLVEILKSIKQSLYSGEYKDTTGLAQREEVNAKESVEFLREPDGTVYGATVGGKIYLNRERLNPNTPIHEYTHLWFSALEKANPELYKRGVELMRQLPIWEEVKTDPNYANLSDDDAIASECLSRLVGDKGAEKLTELAKKAMVRGDIIGTANRITLIEEFKDWLKKFWTWVRDSFAPWSKEEASRVSVDDIQNMVLSDLVKGVNPLARQAESDPYIRFSIVKDPKLIEELDKGPKVRVYRAMQLIDGKLYPPMASKINGEFVRPIELGKWEQADEHPELIDKNGRFNLNKGNGKGLKAAYNPYIHTSRTPLNDQFSEAQSRPNIVTVEVEIPKSELSSGYKADKAKDPVGEMEWKAGIVQGQLTGKRKVILSRWDKPIRIVPDSEVANVIVNDMFMGRTITMPSNVVTPSLRAELEKLGVPFVQTDNTGHIVGGQYDGKHYSKVYGNGALAGNSKSNRMESEIDRIVREAKENGTYMKAPNGNPNIRYKQDGAVNNSRTPQDVEAAAAKLAESLGEKVRIVRDVNEIENRNKKVQESQRKSKGWFNTGTGEIVVVLPNATGIEDVQATILHEAVGHKGLRELVGDDRFDDFLDKVYAAATKATRLEIVSLARRNHWDFRLATEEYIAGLAEKGFSGRENRTLFGKIKDFFLDMLSRAKIALGFNIGDNELRYMLWRTYQMRTSRGILAKANDMAIQQELKVGNFREDQLRGRNGFTENDIAEMETPILESRGTFAKLADAEKWAKENLQGKTFVNSFTGDEINISGHSIKEMLAPKFSKAINEKTHMAAIMSVPDFIETGIPAEIHKDTHGRGYDVMRLYNAIVIDGEPYRVKSTVKRYVDGDRYYTYEIQEMELLKGTQTTALGLDDSSRPQLQSSITGANLLKGVKKTNSDEEILSGEDSRLRFRTSGNGGSSNTARDIYEEKTRVIDRNGRKSDTANLMRRLKEAYVDSMQSLKYLQDAISEETGKPVEDFENAYLAENSMSSKNKAQTDIYLNRFFNPIKDAIRDLQKEGAEYGDIVRYLMAKHGLERNEVFSKRDAEKDGGVWDGSVRRDYSGLTELTRRDTDTVAPRIDEITSRAEDIVRKFEMDHDTDVLWETINAATKDTLRTSYITGMLTKDNYEMVRSMFRYYIPLRGWSENTASAVYDYLSDARPKTSSIVKAATGRTTISDDPIATIAYMGQSAIIQGNRNLMKQKLLNLALNHKTGLLTVSRQWEVLDPVTGMWTPRDPDIPADAAPEQVADIVADFEKDMKEAEKKGVARLSRGKLDTGKHLTAYEGQEHIIKVKRGGIDYSIYLNGNPRAAQAVNGMTNPDAVDSWLIRKARVIKNFMARMFTSQNPAFIISNLSRDVIFAGTAVYAKEDAKYAARYAKNITVALAKGQLIGLIHRFETDRLDNSKDLDRYFGEFIRNGGETGFTQLNTVDDFKRDIDRFAREMKQGQVMKVSTKVWNGIWDGIEYMNRCAEDATRFSVYMTSRQMGRSVERSISDAKEITVNFNRKGSGGFGARLMNFAYIFFNAAVQSLANAGKIMYEHPMKALAALGAFSAAGFMAPLLAQAIISAFGGDDDAYWDLPEWVRRNNFVFYIPWSDNKFLIIPISQELRPFYAMGEIAMSVMMGKEEVLDGLKSAAGSFMDLLPIDFMGNGGNLAISLTPTVAQPLAQLVANTDYFGSPIYRRNDYNKLDPAWTKAYKGTSPMLVNASKWLNEVTGGDDVKRGWIDPINNPAVIEHLFESYLGGTGKTINRAAKTFSMIWNPDMRDIRNVPIASTFIQESDDERVAGNQLNREYFKLMDEFKETSHTVSGYKKKARMGSMEYADKLNEFMETPDFERYSKARGYANTISKLRQVLKRAQESGEDVMVEENLQQILHDLKRQMVEELKEQ